VAAPDDVCAELHQGGDEARGLRVVDDDDVISPDGTANEVEVRGSRALVRRMLPPPSSPPSPGEP
jgi:hypothetical protein